MIEHQKSATEFVTLLIKNQRNVYKDAFSKDDDPVVYTSHPVHNSLKNIQIDIGFEALEPVKKTGHLLIQGIQYFLFYSQVDRSASRRISSSSSSSCSSWAILCAT